jgi:hypothetical protein
MVFFRFFFSYEDEERAPTVSAMDWWEVEAAIAVVLLLSSENSPSLPISETESLGLSPPGAVDTGAYYCECSVVSPLNVDSYSF